MKRLICICAVLVLVQAGLAVLTHWQTGDEGSRSAKGPLLGLKSAEVDELVLEDGEGKRLLLKKDKEQWQLPELGSFPADSARVQGLVDQLAGLQRGWPEGTTTEAATRFKVAADRFERKLTLRRQGADLGVVYFGSSPGLRKIYLRADKDPEIGTLNLTPHELELGLDAWIDTQVLALKSQQLVRVEMPELRLERGEGGLQPTDLSATEEVVKERRDDLVRQLTGLTISSVLGGEAKAEYGLDNPALRYSVELEGGQRIDYLFGQPPQPAGKEAQVPETPLQYVLKVSGRDQLFRVEAWQVNELKGVKRATLVQPKGQPPTEAGPAVASPGANGAAQ